MGENAGGQHVERGLCDKGAETVAQTWIARWRASAASSEHAASCMRSWVCGMMVGKKQVSSTSTNWSQHEVKDKHKGREMQRSSTTDGT